MTGTEAAYVPYILAAVGAGLQYQGAEEEKADRRTILNRSMQQTDATADKAAQAVTKEGQNYTPEQRALDMQAQENAAYTRAQGDLAGAGGDLVTAGGAGGNTSAAFETAKAGKAASEGNRITEIAREFAKVRAPGELQTEEGLRRSAIAGELSNLWSGQRNMNQAGQLDAQDVSSDLGTIGSLVGAAGQAYGAGTGGAGTDAPNNYLNGSGNDASLYTVPGQARSTPSRARINFGGGR